MAQATADFKQRRALLQDAIEIVFATADAIGQLSDQLGSSFIAMVAHKGGERRKQRRMGQRCAFHAIFLGAVPGLGQIFERQLPLGLAAVERAKSRCGRKDRFGGGHVVGNTMPLPPRRAGCDRTVNGR
jgi:hypothetical protein